MVEFYRAFPKIRGGSAIWSDGSPAETILDNDTFGSSVPAQDLIIPLLSNSNTLFEPTLIPQAVTIQLPLLSNSNTLYDATLVPGPVNIQIPLFTNSDSLFSPTIVPVQSIQLPLFSNSDSLYAPSLS